MCGVTKGPSKRKIPWWWNDEVGKEVKEKWIAFLSWKKAKQGLDKKLEVDLKPSYCQIKSETRKVIYRAQSENAKTLRDMLKEGNENGSIFQSSQEDGEKDNKDVLAAGAVKDRNGYSLVSRECSELRISGASTMRSC